MPDTILVLGATGKTGRRLVSRLRAMGAQVRAAGRQSGDGRTHFDWDRPDTHASALAGAAAVYLVAPGFVEDPSPVTGPFLERAVAAGVTRVVAVSSLGVTFPTEPPDSGRRRLEQQVMASGLAWTLLRPTGFAQNFSEGFLLPGIRQADAVMTATGDGAVAFVDADDIAAVAAAALTEPGHAGRTYAVTGPEALTFAEAAAVLSEAAGRPIIHRAIPPEEMGRGLESAGLPADYVAMLLNDQRAVREGAGAQVTDDVARVTGRAATPFRTYAMRAAAAWARV